ncbi:ABC transporter permease [Citreimonas salinaria]|uniref:Putative ABC transport system permease protein n=1 Tax=Citreimonas salinaria TaxID=321339 RepID=A0A1H3EX09_9RHOB|nr:FtsX-like permease family protein [Citreimonas salinaria]SDX83296.1 putative ABC transport system permease protein [Citreimonas salinaria]
MNRAALRALWSHWRRNPLQLFTLVAGLALATALWSGVQAINAEARASYDAAAGTLGQGRHDQLLPAAGETADQAVYLALRRAGWQVSPVVEGRLRTESGSVRVVGLEPLTAPEGMARAATPGEGDLAGFLSDPPLVAAPDVARMLGATHGPVVEDASVAPGTVLTDIGKAQRLLGFDGRVSRFIVLGSQPLNRPPLDAVAPGLVRQPAQGGSDVARLTDSFHLNLTAFGLLSFAVGLFIVHGAIGLAFEQRRGMVRTLRSLGVPLRRLIALMAAELLALALFAGAVGVALGYAIAAALLPDVAATIEGLYGAQVSGSVRVRPEWWLSGLAITLGGAALALLDALWRIARMPILAVAGGRAWALTGARARRWQTAAAVLLLTAAGALTVVGDGLVAAFALLGCLLIGAALALPPVLAGLLTLAERRTRAALWQWFWADTRQQMSGLSLALMALLLAMAANVGVSTMVSSFRVTFTEFLDQRLAADLYVATEDAAALESFAAPMTSEIMPSQSVETRLAGLPAELYGARIGMTYRRNWRFLFATDAPWDAVAEGTAVIVNEQLARRSGLWVGDTLAVAPEVRLPIAGVFGDYGNPIGQAIIAEPLFSALFPEVTPTRFGLRTDDPSDLRRALIDDLGLPESAITDQGALKAFSLQVFERTFTVAGALNVLTLAVAGFAIFMSLLTLAAMRLPQLAPVWALGLRRADLAWLELLRAVVLAALTAVMAVPLGLALAWVLLALVNVEAFGWRLPMFLFPLDYLRLAGVSLVAAALAAAWPARRLARTPPAMLLKVFAHEC